MTIPVRNRKGLTLAELLIIFAILTILAAILIKVFVDARQSSQRYACVKNLKLLGLAIHLYSTENKERYPPVANTHRRFMFDADCVYPEYLTDPIILGCPADRDFRSSKSFRLTADTFLSNNSWGAAARLYTVGTPHPLCMDSTSYLYTGWMIMDDRDMAAGFDIYTWMDSILPISNPATDGWRDRDMNVASFGFDGSGNAKGNVIHRLDQDVGKFLITDIDTFGNGPSESSLVPIIWDQISTNIMEFNHKPAGQNVLYLDGHVEYFRFDRSSTIFPISPLYAAVNSRMQDKRYDFCPQ